MKKFTEAKEAELKAIMDNDTIQEIEKIIPEVDVVSELIPEKPDAKPEVTPEPHDVYKDKYDTLSGKYNAEVGELSKTVKEQQAKINELLTLVAESNRHMVELSKPKLSEKVEVSESKPIETEGIKLDSNTYLTPKDEEDFADFVDVARRAAKQEIGIALSEFVNTKLMPYFESKFSPFAQDINDVKTVTLNSVRDRFYEKMDQLCPTWEQLNTNSEFIAWVEEPDTFSEIPRKEFLKDCVNNNDAKRCAKIFNTYIKEVGSALIEAPVNLNPNANDTLNIVTPNDVSNIISNPDIGNSEMPNPDAFIAPVNRPNNSPPVAEKTVKMLDRNYVTRAMEDYKNHKINFQEVRAKQAEFEIAVKEGRVA